MYALEEVQLDARQFRAAVETDQPYKPLYVKIKVTWTCNLRRRMCNVWRQGRANALDTDALASLIDELANQGCQKIHLSGGEVLTRPDLFTVIEAELLRLGVPFEATVMKCPSCEGSIDLGEDRCPYCGTTIV